MKKSDVNGDNENEVCDSMMLLVVFVLLTICQVYAWLKGEKKGILGLGRIKVCVRLIHMIEVDIDVVLLSGILRNS